MGKPIGKFDFLRAARLWIIKLIDRKLSEGAGGVTADRVITRDCETAFRVE